MNPDSLSLSLSFSSSLSLSASPCRSTRSQLLSVTLSLSGSLLAGTGGNCLTGEWTVVTLVSRLSLSGLSLPSHRHRHNRTQPLSLSLATRHHLQQPTANREVGLGGGCGGVGSVKFIEAKNMDGTEEEAGYKPPPEFQEDTKDSLLELNLSDSTELWLIQWPINHPPDFDGQEVSLKLQHNGILGTFDGSSGKSYDVVSFTSQAPDATVFLSSASDSKIVGKISRRVSLVHYPDPTELQKDNIKNLKPMYQRSSGTFATHTQSTRPRNSGGNAASTHNSRQRSLMYGAGESSNPRKRRHADEPTRSIDLSAQDSGRGRSAVTSSGSLEPSQDKKSKKKKKRKNEG